MSGDESKPRLPTAPLLKAEVLAWYNFIGRTLERMAIPIGPSLMHGIGLVFVSYLRQIGCDAEQGAREFATLWALDAETQPNSPKFGDTPEDPGKAH